MTDTARTKAMISRLGHQGDGVADGPLFAPRTLPGEVVSGIADGSRLTHIRIETPSEHRVQPPCRHYKACGGCQLQHASDAFVAEWKTDVVRNALSAQGLETDFRPIHTSPPRSRRRATLSVRRTKKGAMAGFYGQASDVITEIPDCQLLEPELLAAIPVAEALALAGASRKTPLAVTVTTSDAGLDMLVRNGKPLDGPLRIELAQLAEKHRIARLTWDDEPVAMEQPPVQPFGPALVCPPPGAFLQATREGEAALLAAVLEIIKDAKRVVDLFAGCGTFSLPIAQTAEVHAVEGERDMVKALDAGWRAGKGLKKISTEARDLFRNPLLPEDLNPFGAVFDAAVIDPPRAGAEAQVAQLTKARTPLIAYVSCNPVSFARDAKTLVSAGYDLNWVQVVDQFRWSAHTELAARFTLKD
ncbi:MULTISPECIES: class I SAM-dependent RNA methyltransferase [unclassified Leisingera]|uniref:class I SAM-dependent RNA methyltransferase n=1 Tax=unclassified Leisingera TaxID=2614906 RepID=UPI0002EF715F|nr:MULTISPECIES: class I SAM-dependent RNA methyltransferase [unclassified Leisingera]KIC24323.1 RNA methyltransferase [Leisingera sp. ANG-S3]KIC53039.1 RNA methyltransferase [Leisingera sp. ANG-S]KID10061.1 RNA methyltransferase [Leisingera sp. ANG1]